MIALVYMPPYVPVGGGTDGRYVGVHNNNSNNKNGIIESLWVTLCTWGCIIGGGRWRRAGDRAERESGPDLGRTNHSKMRGPSLWIIGI